jgi:hypothetical protein
MAFPPRRFIPRALSRNRIGLHPLSDSILPSVEEVGIDRVVMRSEAIVRNLNPQARAAADNYHFNFPNVIGATRIDWFQNPSSGMRRAKVVNSRVNSQTLGHIELRLIPKTSATQIFKITMEIAANPTRTLAHLLADYGEHPDFLERITNLSLTDFFTYSDGVEKSLDGNDNWIHNWRMAREHLGPDPFATFLPSYLAKVQEFLVATITPGELVVPHPMGELIRLEHDGIEVEWNTGETTLTEFEVYFERADSLAVGSMREATFAALDGLQIIESDLFLGNVRSDFEGSTMTVRRDVASLQITAPLQNKSSLKIYPKTNARIRFEVRRRGPPRWDNETQQTFGPMERVLGRMEQERRRWLRDGPMPLRWGNALKLFKVPARPQIGDLLRFMDAILPIAARHATPPSRIILPLLSDGGIVADLAKVPVTVLQALERKGVLERVSIQRRAEGPQTARFVLHEQYRAVVQELALLPTFRDEALSE